MNNVAIVVIGCAFVLFIGTILNAQPQPTSTKDSLSRVLADGVGWVLASRSIDVQNPPVTLQIAIGEHLIIAFDPKNSISVELKASALGTPIIDRADLGIFNSFDQVASHLLSRECNESSQELGALFLLDGLVTVNDAFIPDGIKKNKTLSRCSAKIWRGVSSFAVTGPLIEKWKHCLKIKPAAQDVRLHKVISDYLGKDSDRRKYSIGRHCIDAFLIPVLIKSEDAYVIWLRRRSPQTGREREWSFMYSQPLSTFMHNWRYRLFFP